jgi:hypothetical protein
MYAPNEASTNDDGWHRRIIVETRKHFCIVCTVAAVLLFMLAAALFHVIVLNIHDPDK